MRIKLGSGFSLKKLAAVACFFILILAGAGSSSAAAGTDIPSAVCQIVYRVDQFPSEQGYRYIFYGNGFFINEDGYLITAAHVLSEFRNGGQPYILVGPAKGPRRVMEASIVAADWDHDVAILRADPASIQGENKIPYLPLSAETLLQGKSVVSASFRPVDIDNAYSLDVPLADFSQSQVLEYQFHRESGSPESELVLFSQQVFPGQSGSPLLSADSQGVIGIVVGRWLRPTVIPSAAYGGHMTVSPGAALRIHYAISLLEQMHVSWHMVAESAKQADAPASQAKGFSEPVPLSVVGAPYPPQALFGGEVLLDGLIDSTGKITDVRVMKGNGPFLDAALDAVRTWTFSPARMDGRVVEDRIGIVFQFPQSFLPNVVSKERTYDEPFADSDDRGALPVFTVEPKYPATSIAEGSVVLYESVDSQGQVISTSVLRNVESLTAPTEAAAIQWKFVPGKQAGAKTNSAVIVVVTFRRPSL